tara:strand:- start:332 stop:658 length:327 start_codon:yes stop_codon:yes gene_type:complete
MSVPVIPNHPTQPIKMSDIRKSCNVDVSSQTGNYSLKGLSVNSPSQSYNTTFRTILPSTSQTTTNGSLQNWLVGTFGDPTFDTTNLPEHRMSEFPPGRSVETDGHLPR